MNWHAIEPIDVLYLRGNRLFGDPGSYGDAMVPPWPSVAAGALRSAILVRDGIDPVAFARGESEHATLGSPQAPGAFAVQAFYLARRQGEQWEMLFPLPADLVADRAESDGRLHVTRLEPVAMKHGVQGSLPLEKLPVLGQGARRKPESGWWLTEAGWRDYLAGKTPAAETLVSASALWRIDERVGVGLDPARRRADDGKLFASQAVALSDGIGFLAATAGDALHAETLLRFGGDGRGARAWPVDYTVPTTDPQTIANAGRTRIVLTTPGIFPEGWRLPGMDAEGRFELHGVRGRIVSAAVGRAETVSGWDLARWSPKPAHRATPHGSVYWLEALEAAPEALHRLAENGLWPETGYDARRKAEGFNRFVFAAY